MIELELTETERGLLRTLLTEYDELVQADDGDPVLDRLFPVAYRDDPDAAAEFARYTRSGLVDHKTANAGAVAAALTEAGVLRLDDDSAGRWLPVLTDLRLVVADRIGITADDDPVPDDALGEVYHWLGNLQSYLIDALDALADRP
ncbi:MAG TPA: DUF2017 family protein [Pseudolysinimonas sp.]|nr:DUF2017 family protein [Pseudolysinimonas sp.]